MTRRCCKLGFKGCFLETETRTQNKLSSLQYLYQSQPCCDLEAVIFMRELYLRGGLVPIEMGWKCLCLAFRLISVRIWRLS
jgi:hypothetical protein